MPKGHKPRRETKKPKKKAAKVIVAPIAEAAPTDVEVIRKARKPRDEEY